MCGQAGILFGTHNGTICNANYLFRRLGLPRYAEVGSERLFRLADCFAPDGTIDGRGFRKALRLCRGQMSAVLASRLDPGAITVIRGNKPLSLRYSRKHRAVLYASKPEYIDWELQIGDCGIEDIAAVRNSRSQMSNPQQSPFWQ